MPYINVDIDLDDVYDDMNSSEKEQMAEWLEKDGFCNLEDEYKSDNEFEIENPTLLDDIWTEVVKKLFNGRLQLSLEDEETITKIANKL
jgi:hypothetical protein